MGILDETPSVSSRAGAVGAPAQTPAFMASNTLVRGSGSDSGAQALDATVECRVFDLGDEDRGRVEGAPIAEVCAQQVRPDRELAHAGPRCQRGEIFYPLARAAIIRFNRRRSELREGVRLYPHVGVGEASRAPPCLLEQAQAGGDLPLLAGDPAKALARGPLPTSVSPLVTLDSARDIRAGILGAFEVDPARTITVLADAAGEMDKEWSSFVRLQDGLRRAEAARTERDRAVSVLEAYKHMAEGITRRWVWTLLRLTGLDGSPPTVGVLGEPAAARLGELGARIESALVPAMRNAEAHEDFEFDEDTGLLAAGDATFHADEIVARLTDLDILQRALIVGRLAAFADQPALAGGSPGSPAGPSASSAMSFARQRFGHAGQRVRSFVRDRDRLDIVIDELRPEACNPCFLALTQAAQALPTVSRYVIRVVGREDPVIDLPVGVLHANWPVFELAARLFPDALPPVTFLPCLTWVRLSCEPVEEATRVAAWMALNDAQHAILDAEAAPGELARLPESLGLVIAAATATVRLLPQGPHLDALVRARGRVRATASALSDRGPHDVTTNVLMDGILRARDRLGGPPAVLPTVDATPLRERSHPHDVS